MGKVNVLTKPDSISDNFCMLGRVLTYEKCPVCGKSFTVLPDEKGIDCPEHKTVPPRYYINARQFKAGRLYSDPQGHIFDSYKMAHRQLEAMRRDWDNRRFNADDWIPKKVSQYKFDNLILQWQKEYEKEVERGIKARSNYRNIKQRIRDYINPFFKDYDVRDIKKNDIKQFYLQLLDANLADKTVKHILSILHTFLIAIEDDVNLRTPKFPKFKAMPKREKKTMDVVTQMFVLSFVKEPLKLPIEICIDTGIRIGECRGLKKKDLFHEGYLAIQRAFSEGELREQTKEGYNCYKPKIVPTSPAIYDKLIKHAESLNDNDFLFTYKGRPFSKIMLWREWKNACILANVTPIPLSNSTRHSRATNIMHEYMEKGREKAREQIGHRDKRTTIDHYIVEDWQKPQSPHST